jgi:tetratricopeptide (TPR) repeat protein
MVHEFVWVVPDGTLQDALSAVQLARSQVFGKLQMVSLREATTLRREGRVLRGTLLDLPITICELSDLPGFPEPVLLDVDLDYFTTRSAITQGVTSSPWTTPTEVVEALRRHGVRTDLVTISLSTIGGFLPPSSRWLGRALRDQLRMTDGADGPPVAGADPARNLEALKAWADRNPDDAGAWFLLYRSLRALGREEEAASARNSAVRLDPLLEHEALFEGDRLRRNRKYEAALAYYESYLQKVPSTPFLAYTLRRKAGCLLKTGRREEGIRTFWRVIELAPAHADSHRDLAIALRELGHLDLAIEELRMARRILPARADYAMALGTTFLMVGRIEDGIAHLSDAVALKPCWADARRHLALALVEKGRIEEAAGHVRAALVIEPGTPPLNQLATELRRRGADVTRVKSVSFE